MLPYERFDAWKMTHQLALKVYDLTECWPIQERYGLTAQIRRAALSAATNIAEGTAKRGPRELRRYLDISLGSLSEVSYLFRFSRDRGPPALLGFRNSRRSSKPGWKAYLATVFVNAPSSHSLSTALPPYLALRYISSTNSSYIASACSGVPKRMASVAQCFR
jgi:four helix bundle protein